jgi:membrane peptidoglycan carboxypeptidase
MSVVTTPRPPAPAPEAPAPAVALADVEAAQSGGAPVRRRRTRWVVRVVLVVVIALASAFAGNVATNPGITGAPDLVSAFDHAHGSSAEMIAPTDKIAQALVASEDDTFYSNNGVDEGALLRAFWGFLTGQDLGGSTVEMQLAHTLYPAVTEGFWGRVHRVSLALEFDTHYTKAAILSMYLSAVYFGHGYYGIRAASLGYFGVTPAQLNWAEAAMLAGIVQAPSALDPFHHLAAAEARMSYVLGRLVNGGRLTAGQAALFLGAPLRFVTAPAAGS